MMTRPNSLELIIAGRDPCDKVTVTRQCHSFLSVHIYLSKAGCLSLARPLCWTDDDFVNARDAASHHAPKSRCTATRMAARGKRKQFVIIRDFVQWPGQESCIIRACAFNGLSLYCRHGKSEMRRT